MFIIFVFTPSILFLPEKSEFYHRIIDFKISSENKMNQFHEFKIFNIKKENRMWQNVFIY